MEVVSSEEVTQLLDNWSNGDQAALDRLLPLVHEELRRIAHKHMKRERPNHTLQTTALLNEAYLRLVDQRGVRWQNRAHFFAITAQMMRRILIDYSRQRGYAKRGGGMRLVSLDEAAALAREGTAGLLLLDEALTSLAAFDPQQSRIVELRYFGGLTVEETAEALGLSVGKVKREWTTAKAWLYRQMSGCLAHAGRTLAAGEGNPLLRTGLRARQAQCLPGRCVRRRS
jgi:RNA polymerase sigma factor (TIGR02999 family)